jgi:predicted ATPase
VAVLSEKDLNAALAQLVEAELIYQRGIGPDATYQFKHALVQDASYASLVRSRRRQLHGAITRALEQRFPDIVATEPETLAHHSTEAGLTESALSYWLRAGQRATTRSAYQEALRHLERGLALLGTLPESTDRDRRELDFLMALRVPLTAVTGFALNSDYEARSERANILAEKLGDVERLDASLNAQYNYCRATGKFSKARDLAERGRTLALCQGDRVMQLRAHHVMADSLLQRGEFAAAQREFEQVLALYDPVRDRSIPYLPTNQFVLSSTYFAWDLWISGYPERAAKMQAQAFSHAADLKQIMTTGYVRFHAGVQLEQLFGNVSAMLTHTKVLDALFLEHGINTWQGMSRFFKGWAAAKRDGDENGITLMQQALSLLDAKNVGIHVPHFMTLLAEIHAAVGNIQSALVLCGDAQKRIQQTGQHLWLAELHRIDGEIRRVAGHPLSNVEDCFTKALDVSRRQGARMFELRAATALARLWRDHGQEMAASDLLAPVYAWFTEGFDTLDVKSANALLAELSV